MMKRSLIVLAALVISSLSAGAQLLPQRAYIRALGQASVSSAPDQVKVNVGVVTQAPAAQDAAAQNAAQVSNVLAQLRQLLGASADIKTIAYSLTANYNTSQALVGYTASNTVEVTSGDLSAAGRIIDTATQAGANRILGVQFSLKDPQPLRVQALRAASQQAKVNAEAIAAGLGVRTGVVISAEEGGVAVPVDTRILVPTGATTPIEPGLVSVSATVTLQVEILR